MIKVLIHAAVDVDTVSSDCGRTSFPDTQTFTSLVSWSSPRQAVMTAYEFTQAPNAYKEKKFVCVKFKNIIEDYLYRKRIFVGMKWIHLNQI